MSSDGRIGGRAAAVCKTGHHTDALDVSFADSIEGVLGADGKIRAWPLWWGSSAAWHGTQLLEMLPGAGFHDLKLGRIPESGVHLDVPGKALGVWLTNPDPGLFRWLGRLWPGWRIDRWDDRYEEHFRRCGPSITAASSAGQ